MICLLAFPAQAQAICGNRDDIVEQLKKGYKEVPAFRAMTASGGLFEVFISQHGDTWTVILTQADGSACLMAAGEHWQEVQPATRTGDPA